jgi:hypothetical protein
MIVAAAQVAVQNSAYRPARRQLLRTPGRARVSSLFVRPEYVAGGAAEADPEAGFDVAEGQGHTPVGVEATDLIAGIRVWRDPAQAAKRAATYSSRGRHGGRLIVGDTLR